VGLNEQGLYNSPHLRAVALKLGIAEPIKETSSEDAPIYLRGKLVGRCRTRPDFITFSKKTPPKRHDFWRDRLMNHGFSISNNKWLRSQGMVTILRFTEEDLEHDIIREWIADGYE
jgi:hypothetical protein